MFIVFLKFGANKDKIPSLMEAHNAWIAEGFSDGVFLTVGGLEPAAGGAILAHGESFADLEARVARDPFVAEGAAAPEIIEFQAKRTDPRLDFLKG